MTKKKIAFREKRKGNKNKRCRYLRKRKPKRQGSRNQTGKRMPVWYSFCKKRRINKALPYNLWVENEHESLK